MAQIRLQVIYEQDTKHWTVIDESFSEVIGVGETKELALENLKHDLRLFYKLKQTTFDVKDFTIKSKPMSDKKELTAQTLVHLKVNRLAILLPEQPEEKKENLYEQLKNWLSETMLNPNWTWQQVTKDDGQYFAINDGKRFVAFNHDLKFGKTWFGIREDGDTRTVFNGIVETLEDAKRIWDLTNPS